MNYRSLRSLPFDMEVEFMLENKIYQRIAANKQPFAPPGPWANHCGENSIFRPQLDRARLLVDLQAEFNAEELLASGVVITNPAGSLELLPALAQENALLFAARRGQTLDPFDLVLAGGTLQNQLPALAMLDDYRLAEKGRRLQTLLIAFSMRDVAILSSFGFPVVLGSGLEHLGGGDLKEFCLALGLRMRAVRRDGRTVSEQSCSGRLSRTEPVTLVLVAWTVSEVAVTVPPAYKDVEAHLQNLAEHLEVQFEGVRTWKPTAGELAQFEYCLKYGDAEHIATAMHESWADEWRGPAASYPEAVARGYGSR